MYRKKSGNSIRAATKEAKINTASTPIPKIAIVCIVDPPLAISIFAEEYTYSVRPTIASRASFGRGIL